MPPLYYFDLIRAGKREPDEDGTDLSGLEAAKAEAIRTLGEIVAKVPSTDVHFEIRSEAGEVLCSVSLSADDC